jgi:hypothetical protein
MIAPARTPSPHTDHSRRAVRRARRLIAESLLASRKSREPSARHVPAWQAWLAATWVVTIAAVFGAMMFKWWRGG